jgi:D-3-phosphoglycerate dehydrogenase
VNQLQGGQWQRVAEDAVHNTIGRALKGDVLGIWSYGKIGQRMAHYARAFDMEVLIWGRSASLELARAEGHRVATSKESFFAEADVVTLHLRLNDATRGIVTASDLAQMKPGALLLNTSRAELIEPGALLAALQLGRPGFAALDVFEQEPLPTSDPLLQMANVVATPHLGYVEQKGYQLYFLAALRNVLAFAAQAKV